MGHKPCGQQTPQRPRPPGSAHSSGPFEASPRPRCLHPTADFPPPASCPSQLFTSGVKKSLGGCMGGDTAGPREGWLRYGAELSPCWGVLSFPRSPTLAASCLAGHGEHESVPPPPPPPGAGGCLRALFCLAEDESPRGLQPSLQHFHGDRRALLCCPRGTAAMPRLRGVGLEPSSTGTSGMGAPGLVGGQVILCPMG